MNYKKKFNIARSESKFSFLQGSKAKHTYITWGKDIFTFLLIIPLYIKYFQNSVKEKYSTTSKILFIFKTYDGRKNINN
jgi:hypothetical protein